MESLLSLIMILVFVATFSYFEAFLGGTQGGPAQATPVKVQESAPQQKYETNKTPTASVKPAAFVEPTVPVEETEQPAFSAINTYIISGPKEGAIIEGNEVVFRFKAKVPEEIEGKISFETKVTGLDEDWKKTSKTERKIIFKEYPKEYTFFVRTVVDDDVDPTPAKRTFKVNLSPYFEKVKISNIKFENSSNPSLITLNAYLQKDEEIDITGWQIKGKTRSFFFPKGMEEYSPYLEPIPQDDIIIKQGDVIYLSGAQNPLGEGLNFRPNKCMGYLAENHDFAIFITKNCPKPDNWEIADLNICCREFISKLARCEIPNYSKSYSVSGDPECISYLDNYFNYGSCFKRYSKDDNFLEKKWHVYMNRNLLLNNNCDTLYLFDRNGLLVHEYSYGSTSCR